MKDVPAPGWLDPLKMEQAQKRGLSAVCATCVRYWQARDADVPGDECLAGQRCGSPLAGLTFPEYTGMMPRLDRWCFVCGVPQTHVVRVKGHEKNVVGICAEHLPMLLSHRPSRSPDLFVGLEVSDGVRGWMAPEKYLPKPKLRLGQVLHEVQQHLDAGGKV